jgi:hypothetical protein
MWKTNHFSGFAGTVATSCAAVPEPDIDFRRGLRVDLTPPDLPAMPAHERGRLRPGAIAPDREAALGSGGGRTPARPQHPADRAGAVACAVGSGLIVSVMVWSLSTPFTGMATVTTVERLMPVALAVGLGALTTAAVCWRLVAGLARPPRARAVPARLMRAVPAAERARRRLSGVR